MNKWIAIGSIVFMFMLAACSEKVYEEPIRPVRYETVHQTGGERFRSFSGVAQTDAQTKLSFKVPGTIDKLTVKIGDKVQTGLLVAQLDPADYELQIEELTASINQVKAGQRKAQADYDRLRALYENGNASRNDLDAARAGAESSSASIKALERKRDQAALQLKYTNLRAPHDGSVSAVPVELNENVGAGQVIVMLTSSGRREVKVSVPEAIISKITEGDLVDVTFDARPNETYRGKIMEVGVATMAATYPVTVFLLDEANEVRSGMAAEVKFNLGFQAYVKTPLVVNPMAVGEDRDGKRFVFLLELKEQGLANTIYQEVEVGELTPEGLEVLEGLKNGDKIVTAGISRIMNGQTVKVQESE